MPLNLKNRQFVISSFHNEIDTATQIIESELPVMGPHDLLIKHTYVGINALYDRELYRGNVPYIDVQFPYTFGVEAVGEIMAMGDEVRNWEIGDAVSTVKVGTAYQQYQVLNASLTVRIPEATAEYLTLNPTGTSALLALEKTGEVRQGETVVISAAAGGLGHLMVQLCKMKGCHVVAICGGKKKVGFLNNLDVCDRIIDYKNESVDEVLDTEYKDKIDVAIDSVGREIFDLFLRNLAPLGRLVVCGAAAELSAGEFEHVHQPRVYSSIYWKGASVRCFMNHLFRPDQPEARERLFDMYQKHALKVRPDETLFEGVNGILEASKYLLAGKSCGKVVVKM